MYEFIEIFFLSPSLSGLFSFLFSYSVLKRSRRVILEENILNEKNFQIWTNDVLRWAIFSKHFPLISSSPVPYFIPYSLSLFSFFFLVERFFRKKATTKMGKFSDFNWLYISKCEIFWNSSQLEGEEEECLEKWMQNRKNSEARDFFK